MTNSPGPWAQHTPPSPHRPHRSVSGGKAVLLVVAALVGLCGFGSLIAVLSTDNDNKAATLADTPIVVTTAPDRGSVPTTDAPKPTGLKAADVKLSVKITDKQCFGSAGCNVQWEIKAGWPEGKVTRGDSCDVTYEVRGLTDAKIGTLTIRDDDQYLSDDFALGQTKRRSDKITARVTEVECR